MTGTDDLTWDELDLLVDTDTIALRDRAWAEIHRLRTELERLNTEHGHAIRELRALRDLEDVAREVRVSGAAQHLDAPLAALWPARRRTAEEPS
jgi:hypothetical protein